MNYKIPFIKPSFPNKHDLLSDYEAILEANWYTNFGPYEKQFTKKIGNYIGEDYYSAAFSSATTGLMASIIAVLDKGDGSKYILMPAFTFAAGAEAILWGGYKPLFIDIETKSLQMNIEQAEKAIEEHGNKIAAILFCNAFGVGAPNIKDWENLSGRSKKPLIIDSAAGFGSLYSENHKVGSAGVCEVFSFHATKPFAIGEGGAVVSKDERLIKKLTYIQNFGFDDTKTAHYLGFNAKMQEINAAIGIRQLKVFDSKLDNRRRVYSKYVNDLDPAKYAWQDNAQNASLCFATAILRNGGSRDKVIQRLQNAGIEAKKYYSPALHKHPYFKQVDVFSNLECTNFVGGSVISLPIHDSMQESDINLIIKTLNEQE